MAEAALDNEGQEGAETGVQEPAQTQQTVEGAQSGSETQQSTDTAQGEDPLASGAESQGEPREGFPDNWRDLMANGDDKLAKQLQNFTSPDMVAKAFADLRKKISSGDYKQTLPDDATDEEIAQWRKDNGVPDSPEGYKLELPSGFEFDEVDQPIVESFQKAAHEANLPNDAVNSVMNWYAQFQEEQRTQMATADAEHQEQAIQELRSSWPQGEYKANLNAGRELLQSVGEEFADWLFHARGPDGMAVGNHPGFRQFLAQMAQERNPAASLLPTGQNNEQGINSRIQEIEKYMREDRRAYNKDQAVQQELMRLYEARERLAKQ